MKVLVLGGTGAMGVYLLPKLIENKHEVFATSRNEKKSNSNVEWITGNAKDIEFVNDILINNKFDTIVDFMLYNTNEFKERKDLFLRNTGQYIFLSTYRIFDNSQSPIVENSPRLLETSKDKKYLNSDEYALTKARQEDLLRSSGKKNWTIIRPSITYSKNRLQLGNFEADTTIFRSSQNLPIVLPKEILDRQTTMTWSGDVANMISSLVGNPKALGEDFNVVTDEHVSWREIAEIYAKYSDLKIEEISLKKFLRIPGIAKYQVLCDRVYDRIMDNSKILNVTNIQSNSFKKLENGLKEEIIYFKKNPNYTRIDYAMNGRMDKLTQKHINLKNISLANRLRYLKGYFTI